MDLIKTARSLGIVSKIFADDSLNAVKTSKEFLKNQMFQYVVVIDFETTCWPNQRKSTLRKNEIIELPAVFYDLTQSKIVEEFQKFVKPTENPILSDYCLNFTGIKQDDVNNAIILSEALNSFYDWIKFLSNEYSLSFPIGTHEGNCAFVTWTNADLGEFLREECIRKCIQIPNIFNAWIDLRALFMEFIGMKPVNLSNALKLVGLTFQGREHSGICDARNTAILAGHLVKCGLVIRITKDINKMQDYY